jgi:hypothetical protein
MTQTELNQELQASVRLTGQISREESNKATAEMFSATMTANRTLRSLNADQLNELFPAIPDNIIGVIRHMNAGHLSLPINEPAGI